jgi:hypothetical protein
MEMLEENKREFGAVFLRLNTAELESSGRKFDQGGLASALTDSLREKKISPRGSDL